MRYLLQLFLHAADHRRENVVDLIEVVLERRQLIAGTGDGRRRAEVKVDVCIDA